MKLIKGKTFADVYEQILSNIYYNCEYICKPRDQRIKEITNLIIEIEDPTSNLFINEARSTPERYLAAELYWYFSGRNDAEFISNYSKFWNKIVNLDNKTVNSAYGYLLFKDFNMYGINEWQWALNSLFKDKDSRQAIIRFNKPNHSYNNVKDFVCLRGNTEILSPEGNVTIQKLVEIIKEKGKYPVYSVNFETKEREIQWCRRAWKTGRKKIIRVYIDDNTYIDCTENHKFYIKKRIYDKNKKHRYHIEYKEVEAKNLKPNDSLINFNIIKNDFLVKGFIKSITGNYCYKNQVKESICYYEFYYNKKIKKGNIIHHKNKNSYDNSIQNLEEKSLEKHVSDHQIGENNPVFKIKNKKEFYKKIGNSVSNFYKNNLKVKRSSKNKISKEELIKIGKEAYEKYGKFNRKIYRDYFISEYGNKYFKEIKFYFDSWNNYKSIIINNHKVKKIEYLNIEDDVYDLEVDNNHNVFIGSGVLVHNCTLTGIFNIRDDKLNFTIIMRSQDEIKGRTFDVPFFTLLQQQMLNHLKTMYSSLQLGSFVQHNISSHIYERDFPLVEDMLANKFESNGLPSLKENLIDIDGNFNFNFNKSNDKLITWIRERL